MTDRPHWINVTGRSKGAKFMCSDCAGTCICLHYGFEKTINTCNYKYCPRCGVEMDITNQTRMVTVEEAIKRED